MSPKPLDVPLLLQSISRHTIEVTETNHEYCRKYRFGSPTGVRTTYLPTHYHYSYLAPAYGKVESRVMFPRRIQTQREKVTRVLTAITRGHDIDIKVYERQQP
jgi:hypothetical protein